MDKIQNGTRQGSLVVVDNDPNEQAALGYQLKLAGYNVVPALTAGAVLPIIASRVPDLIVLEPSLPDFSGSGLIRALSLLGCLCPVAVLRRLPEGRFAPSTLDGNAPDAVSDRLDPAALVQAVRTALATRVEAVTPRVSVDIAHRWAEIVIRGCSVDSDIRTVPCWASRVGVSGGSLREMCRILNIAPHNAKELTRILNALIRAHRYQSTIESVLDASDRRTIDRLLSLSGLQLGGELPTVATLLHRQQWIPNNNGGMRVLTDVFQQSDESAPTAREHGHHIAKVIVANAGSR